MPGRVHTDVLFAEDATSEQYILLQLEDKLLAEPLYIKASGPNSTVLCTDSQTYALKEVQQSNALLFLKAASGDGHQLQVAGEAASWLEIAPTSVQIDLSSVPTYATGQPERSVPRETLFASIPASHAEIQAALDYAFCIDIGGGQIARAPMQAVVDTLVDLAGDLVPDDPLLALAVRKLCTAADDPTQLDVDKICRTIARHVLATQSPCTVDRFMLTWRAAAPVAYRDRCNLGLATGLYLQPTPTTVVTMPVLSEDPRTRVSQLFDARDRWPEKEFTELGGQVKFAKRVRIGKESFVEARR